MQNLFTIMFLSRVFGRALFAAARSETSASAAAAATAAREGHNPLQEFFEVDRSPEDDKPVVYGMEFFLLLLIGCLSVPFKIVFF